MVEKIEKTNIKLEDIKITYFCPECYLHHRECMCVMCNSTDLEKTEWGKCKNCNDIVILSIGESKTTFCESCGERL